jgi:primary-amine oxidase
VFDSDSRPRTSSRAGDGLPKWTAAGRPMADTGIAAWHTIGVTHFCTPEDFPVMPCEYAGFTLKPFGFFDRNPGINVAPSASAHGGQCVPGEHGVPGKHRAFGEHGHAGETGMPEGSGLADGPACT